MNQPPALIRDLPGWLLWKFEPDPAGKKPRKIPYYTNGVKRHGIQGSTQDRKNLKSFEQAQNALTGYDGVGFALLPEFNITALDFDNCVTDGEVHPDITDLTEDTYAELSPSRRGVRVFCQGDLGNYKDAHSEPFGMEVFSTKGYVTFTGLQLPLTQLLGNTDVINPPNAAIPSLYRQRFTVRPDTTPSTPLGLSNEELNRALLHLDPDMPHEPWLQVGMSLHHETRGVSFTLWDDWSRQSSKYPGSDVLRARWESFGNSTRSTTARTLIKLANAAGADIGRAFTETDTSEFPDLSTTLPPPRAACRFQVIPAAEFGTGTPTSWLIKHVIPRAELVVMYGASGSGKSFMALDMVAAIAQGKPWRGKKTTQGRVVYVAAEGAGGFRNRLKAYSKARAIDLSALSVGVIAASPNMMELAHAKDVVRAVTESGGAQVVVIDTFAQVMPGGNENAGEDVGKAMGHCKLIHRDTGATVILIHHSGKDTTKGARGWSGLRAAADTELEVIKAPTGRVLRMSKQKDGDDSGEWGFALEVVEVGIDEDLEPITSCVVIEADVGSAESLAKMGPVESLAYKVVMEFGKAQTTGIELHAVIDECKRRMDGPKDGKRDTRNQVIKRALKQLCADGGPFLEEDGCFEIL